MAVTKKRVVDNKECNSVLLNLRITANVIAIFVIFVVWTKLESYF